MNRTAQLSVGAGLGAGLMYLLDPARGNRRRALIRDKMIRLSHKTRDAAGATRRDMRNRFQGASAQLRSRFEESAVDDRRIIERVRAELGRYASHPRAIYVTAENGRVTLTGDVLASEHSGILRTAERTRGVVEVHDVLTTHDSAANVPSLQGESERPGRWSSWMRSGWSPTAMAMCAGSAAAAMGIALARKRTG